MVSGGRVGTVELHASHDPAAAPGGRLCASIPIRFISVLAGIILTGLLVSSASAVFGGSPSITNNTFATLTLDPPTSLEAVTSDTPGSIDLSWTPTVDTNASGYRVLRGTATGGPFTQVAQLPSQATFEYADTGLVESGVYFYVVRAYLNSWESADSSQVSAAAGATLGVAARFAVLAGASVINGGASTVVGDIGVSPASTITGAETISLTGSLHPNDALAVQAQSDLADAYNQLAANTCDSTLSGQDLGGMTLTPGVYCFGSSAQLTGTLTLDRKSVV